MPNPPQTNRHYDIVAASIRYLRAHARAQPGLGEIAAAVGLSEFHLQRVFSEWAGISPKRFLQHLNKEHARNALRESADLLSASLAAGLSTPSRLHDLMVTCEAMTPAEVRAGGAGLEIRFGEADTPFGNACIGWTRRGLCHLEFCPPGSGNLRAAWPAADLCVDPAGAEQLARQIFPRQPEGGRLHLLLRGSNFQLKVWEALLRIPPGHLASYTQLSRLAGVPRAQRAVGSALAANAIAYLIPCHRVIRESGEIGQYRWHSERKQALIAWEAAQR